MLLAATVAHKRRRIPEQLRDETNANVLEERKALWKLAKRAREEQALTYAVLALGASIFCGMTDERKEEQAEERNEPSL